MSLEPLELELLQTSGSERQKRYAKKIAPVRAAGNRLLCTLVLTNVGVYTALPVLYLYALHACTCMQPRMHSNRFSWFVSIDCGVEFDRWFGGLYCFDYFERFVWRNHSASDLCAARSDHGE